MKLLKALLIHLLLINIVNAEVVIDVYGVDEKTGNKILKKYKQEISDFSHQLYSSSINKNNLKVENLRVDLISKIRSDFNLNFVEITPIQYFNNATIYTTVESR